MVKDKEIWKDIPNYIGYYQVSNHGNIKSLPREVKSDKITYRKAKERILILSGTGTGSYWSVTLSKYSIKKYFKVASLVALVFMDYKPINRKIVIDHINGNRKNNHVDNLQIISQRLNASKDKKNKTSRFTGVSWSKKSNKWIVHIKINGKSKHLGLYDNEDVAGRRYYDAVNSLKI